MPAVILNPALIVAESALRLSVRVTPDEPNGPGSDWGATKVLAISFSLGAVLIIPLLFCLAHRCFLTHKRKKMALSVAEARAAAVLEARLAAVQEARAEGNDARADAIQEIIDRDASLKLTGKEAALHRTSNLMDRYASQGPGGGVVADEEAGSTGLQEVDGDGFGRALGEPTRDHMKA